MNILMSSNNNEGYGAMGRYVELVNSLLKYKNIQIFFISPEGYDRSSGKNFTHIGYKKNDFRPNFIYSWLVVTITLLRGFSTFKKIDKCVLFNGSNSFIFALFKNFFSYELIYSIRANIILNNQADRNNHRKKLLTNIFNTAQFKFYYFLEKYTLSRSDKIVFQSEVNAKEYKDLYGITDEKIFILNNNCNPSWVGQKSNLNLPKGFNVGYLGNIYKNKGLKVLIDAFQLVSKKNHNCNLTVIGDGPDRSFFQNYYVKKVGVHNVRFLGHLNKGQNYIHNFDLMVVPSFMEAFPNVILESLYYNTPVLASDVGGIPVILDKYFLFQVGDYKGLSQKIEAMLDEDSYGLAKQKTEETRSKFLFDWGGAFYNIIKKN